MYMSLCLTRIWMYIMHFACEFKNASSINEAISKTHVLYVNHTNLPMPRIRIYIYIYYTYTDVSYTYAYTHPCTLVYTWVYIATHFHLRMLVEP